MKNISVLWSIFAFSVFSLWAMFMVSLDYSEPVALLFPIIMIMPVYIVFATKHIATELVLMKKGINPDDYWDNYCQSCKK